jgi:CubicO group peptidase (beta-lactamase class C family)
VKLFVAESHVVLDADSDADSDPDADRFAPSLARCRAMKRLTAEPVAGWVDPAFAPVADAFRAGFARRSELGAAVCVIVGGRVVVDLWGGVADHVTGRPWTEHTPVLTFSSTKGVTAACAHVLATRGRLDLGAPVARYWPELGGGGRDGITVRMLLNHRAGLAAIDRRLPAAALLDWPTMVRALEGQTPNWEPGTAHGYHALTFGWLLGEVVRRVDGRSLGTFFAEEMAQPLGLEFWIGLPPGKEEDVARVRPAPLSREVSPLLAAMRDPRSLSARAFANPPGLLRGTQFNSVELQRAEVPAANGIGTARGLAGLYAALLDRRAVLVDRDGLRAMTTAESAGPDRVLLLRSRFSAGFMQSVENPGTGNSVRFGPNSEAFGHVGAGGSFGMGDPTAGVAIAYVMNQLGHGVMLNERGQALIDATYGCLARS